MDRTKLGPPSNRFEDRTDLLYKLLSPWDRNASPDLYTRFTGPELERLAKDAQKGKYTKFLEIFRERMRNEFLRNFFMEGGNRAHKNFDFYQEDFDQYSNMRKRNQGAYDNN